MRIVTTKDRIQSVVKEWRKQYPITCSLNHPEKIEIYEKLLALDLSVATEADITKIIGNDSWTILICDECNRTVDAVVELGEVYYKHTICVDCLIDAAFQIRRKKATESL